MIGRDGNWIRAWRATNGYTQETLAWELDVKRQTIIAWEKAPKLDRLIYLALTALENEGVRQIGLKDPPPR